jgi:hypothetical protein
MRYISYGCVAYVFFAAPLFLLAELALSFTGRLLFLALRG